MRHVDRPVPRRGADHRHPGGAARSRHRQCRRAGRAARHQPPLARAALRRAISAFRPSCCCGASASCAASRSSCSTRRQLDRGARLAVLRPGAVRARLPLVHGHDAERIRRDAPHPILEQDHGAAHGATRARRPRPTCRRCCATPPNRSCRAIRGLGARPRARYRRAFMTDYTTLERDALARIEAAADLAALEALRVDASASRAASPALLKTLGGMTPERAPGEGPADPRAARGGDRRARRRARPRSSAPRSTRGSRPRRST